MADEDRSFASKTVQANRARAQGQGLGQEELDMQQDPNRNSHATDPQRTEPFDPDLEVSASGDRPTEADFSGQDVADLDDRNAAGLDDAGDLGASTPPNVDIHDLAQEDNPEEDWGEPAGGGATFSSTNTRRGVRTEAERGQGAKTRRHNKDIISRRT